MFRVAVVVSHPIQYLSPWFRALDKHVELEVFYCHRQDAEGQAAAGFGEPFEWDVPLLDGYSSRWLVNLSDRPGVAAFAGCDTPEIGTHLQRGRFDACVVSGWYLKSYVQAIRACWRLHLPVFVRGDSHRRIPRSALKSAMKYLPYRWWLKRVDAHLYVGAANREYLESYGVTDDRLFFTPHFVDNEFFHEGAGRARQDGEPAAVRRRYGIPADATVFLFVGKFIAQKRPHDFIRAIAGLRDRGHWGLIVGSGPLDSELRRFATDSGAPVAFAGFRNQSELPPFYAAADAIVLPSQSESWGLVVNEAMACGLPAIVSDAVGCAPDLIDPGTTGFAYPAGAVDALASAMDCLGVRLRSDRAAIAAAARERVARYSAAAAVEGLEAALTARIGHAHARTG